MTNRLQVHDAIINHNAHYSNSRYASNYQPHGAQNGSPQIGITYGYQQIAIPSSELSYPSPKSNSEIAEAYPQTPMMVRLRTDDDDKMYPIPAYAMYLPGVIMPQQLSSYQSGVQAVVTQQSGVQTITQQSSGEEAAEAESPNASTVIYPQQFPVVYSQVPGFAGYPEGVSAMPFVLSPYSVNVAPSGRKEQSYGGHGQGYGKECSVGSGRGRGAGGGDKPNANLFVFNIPSRFKDDDLRRLFEPFGRVLSCKVEAMTMGEI